MRSLIDYIRSCFCKHDWERIDKSIVYITADDKYPIGTKWTYRCKKCGRFKTYKDYKR